jgi:hypothetical protein
MRSAKREGTFDPMSNRQRLLSYLWVSWNVPEITNTLGKFQQYCLLKLRKYVKKIRWMVSQKMN